MRKGAWDVFKARIHIVDRVYVFDTDSNDLLFTGHVTQTMHAGKEIYTEWVGRIELVRTGSGKPKLKTHCVWAVSFSVSIPCEDSPSVLQVSG